MPASLRIARSRARPAEYHDQLTEAVAGLNAAREARDATEDAFQQAQDEVLTILAGAGIATSTVVLDDARYKITAVRGERLDFNEVALRKAVSAPVFDKLCDLKLNRNKLEQAIAEGRVDPILVASHTVRKQNKPHVKVTLVAGSEH